MGRKVKIQLYSKDKTKEQILNSFGDYVLDEICTSCSVEEDLYTTEYFLDAEFIVDDKGLYKHIEEDAVLKVQIDYGEEIFSIADVRKTPNRIIVFARQITITESICSWLDDVRPEGKNGQDALNHMNDNSIGQHNLEFESDISVENTAFYVDKTLYDALHTADNCFAMRWGGEVRRRGYKIIINEELGGESDVQIRSGRNLTGFEATTNIDSIATRIIPKGFNGITTEEPVDSPLLDTYKYVRTQIMDYSHVKLRADLEGEPAEEDLVYDSLAEAQIKLEELALMEYLDGIDKLRADYTINFIDLSKTEEYKNYAKAELVQLGEEVNVYEEKHDINIKVRAIKRKYNILNQSVIEMTLSNYNIAEEDKKTADAIEAVKSRLDKIVEDIGYMNITYAKIEDVEIVNAEIKDLKADMAEIGNLDAVNAEIENLKADKANITDLEVAVADIVSLKAKDAEIENLVADVITVEDLNAINADIENLKADKANITDLNATNAEIENLRADIAEIEDLSVINAEIENLKAKDAEIENLVADKATIERMDVAFAEIEDLKAWDADIVNLVAGKADITDLNATNAEINNLKAKDAEIENLVADVITVEDLDAINADIHILNADIANIKTLVNGNLSSENIHSLKLVAEGATIEDATIASIDAETITSGWINTENIRIGTNNMLGDGSTKGYMTIRGARQSFYDSINSVTRLQIGLDSKGEFSFILRSADNNIGVLINQDGIQTGAAIGDRIVADNHISDSANIDGSKLNIGTVITGINNDDTTYLKSNKIYLDDEEQTLDVQFKELSTRVKTIEGITVSGDLTSVIEQINTNTTAIGIAQGEIDTLVEETTITKKDGTTVSLKSAYSETSQTVDTLSNNITSLTTNYNELDGRVNSVSSKQTSMEQTLDGFTTTVEELDLKVGETNARINTVEQRTTSTAITNTIRETFYRKDEIDYLLNSNKDDTLNDIENSYAKQEDLTTWREESSSQMVQTSNDFTMKFTEAKVYTKEVENELISYKEEVATNIRFSNDGIEIGKTDSAFKTVLDNEKLAFVENGTEVAYISNNKMNITNAEVEEELKMGQFSWTSFNGHLRLRKG